MVKTEGYKREGKGEREREKERQREEETSAQKYHAICISFLGLTKVLQKSGLTVEVSQLWRPQV